GRSAARSASFAGARRGQCPGSSAVVVSVWKSALKLITRSAAASADGSAGAVGIGTIIGTPGTTDGQDKGRAGCGNAGCQGRRLRRSPVPLESLLDGGERGEGAVV